MPTNLDASVRISQAVLFKGPSRPLELCTLAIPEVGAVETVVKIEYCTICGSDLHSIQGDRGVPVPTVLGHEIIGTIIEVGSPLTTDIHGNPLNPGDRVTWSRIVSCGKCDRCKMGLTQKCRRLYKYGHEVSEGRFALNGGFAEYILLRSDTQILKISDTMPKEVICPANCATATVANAFRQIPSIEGKTVLVFGCGMLGLTAIAMANALNAAQITVCDINSERLSMSQQFGAGFAIQWSGNVDELKSNVLKSTGIQEFDVVLELSGAPHAVSAAIEMGAVGSSIVLAGSVSPSPDIAFDPESVVRRCLQIVGVHNYTNSDLITAVEFLEQNYSRYPFKNLVEREFQLNEIEQAIEYALVNKPVRVAICP